VVAKVRERLAVSKQTTQRVYMEKFNLKKLNEVEGKEQYRVEISNRFAAMENLDTEVDNRATGIIKHKFPTCFGILSQRVLSNFFCVFVSVVICGICISVATASSRRDISHSSLHETLSC
jgi:hypothetical protein